MLKPALRTLAICLTLAGAADAANDPPFQSPTVLVLGDSQIPFGSGPAFLEFFENILVHCPPELIEAMALKALADMKVAVIGVRSTSLHSWTARGGAAKGAICDVDPKWKVNAGTFGTINTTGNKYKQIGRGAAYQFCRKGQSAFEAMFRDGYYTPKLVVMNFLGNSAKRWAHSYEDALDDVRKMNAQVPGDTACIFMTTAPSYSKKITDLRLRAQAHVKRAMAETGSACSFVAGLTKDTVAANQGNKSHFRRAKSGRVKDPYHPNARAAAQFFKLRVTDICGAVRAQVARVSAPTVTARAEQHASLAPR
ncbi:MAG: SGNH/GDSL hydrolase family protein [Pseudomonadota bacterium]